MDSFFFMGAKELVADSPTIKLHQLIDWREIESQFNGIYKRDHSGAGGPIPYHPLKMFKLMLLGQWHGLSDEQLEHTLKIRLDFMVFSGFEPGAGELPDASTICRFRNRLVGSGIEQRLLKLINQQLQTQGLKVSGSRGAIIDATIISSAARPRKHLEQSEEGVKIVYSADDEARWLKKGNKSYFGYRSYAATETEDGYVEHIVSDAANVGETTKLVEIVEALPAEIDGILADKGFASEKNRQYLKSKGLADYIQHKTTKGKKLNPWLKQINKAIAGVRFKVEQCFGTLKRRFHLGRARYFGIAKVQAQTCWAAIGMNLLKAHNKLKKMQPLMDSCA